MPFPGRPLSRTNKDDLTAIIAASNSRSKICDSLPLTRLHMIVDDLIHQCVYAEEYLLTYCSWFKNTSFDQFVCGPRNLYTISLSRSTYCFLPTFLVVYSPPYIQAI